MQPFIFLATTSTARRIYPTLFLSQNTNGKYYTKSPSHANRISVTLAQLSKDFPLISIL